MTQPHSLRPFGTQRHKPVAPGRRTTQTAALLVLLLAGPACTLGQSAAGDPDTLKRGKILFLQCRACHSLAAGEDHRVGPNLHGLFGSKAGTKAGFNYSEAMRNSGIVWDAASLGEFLTMPSARVPGTIMAFAGVAAQGDRDALLGYLRSQTNP